jgi:PKD repeat protein
VSMSRKLHFKGIAAILIVVLSFCGIERSLASHAMGADLTYQCLGGNTYKLRVSFYRDCIGIAAPASVTVNVRSTSCGQNFGITCLPIAGTGNEVNALCPTAVTTCNGGVFTGIQEWIYEGIVTLPMQCADWTFSWTHCCRNAAINTITTPGASTFYIYATLNNTVVQCNNSPTFSNKPVPFACLGQTFQFNHGAVDADGDSLVYSLVTPKQTANSTVNYIAPYTASAPLASTPSLQFNAANGDILFSPTMIQVTVMAVLVKEYRNGILIGSVVRDIQVTVINCNNNLPTLTGINGTNNFDTTVCATTPLCFDIYSNDADAGQALNISWNNGIDSGSFISNNTQHPTGTFCWTPRQQDISNSPYCFTVRVNDDACPYVGSQTYSYCVTVRGVVVDAGPDQNIACSDLATINATVTTGAAPFTYLWSNGWTNPAQTVGVGTYIVTVTDANGCQGSDTVRVISAFEPVAAFTYSGTCLNMPFQFTDASTTPGGAISSWSWAFGDGTFSNVQNPIHIYSAPGTYNVTLAIENTFGCQDTVVIPVTIAPLPVPSFTPASGCAGSALCFTNTSTPGTVWWNFGNGNTSTLNTPCITFPAAGTYTVTLAVQNAAGCADTLSRNVVINPVPTANFGVSGNICQNSSVQFVDSSTGAVSWLWNFGNGSTSTLQNPLYNYNTSGTYNVSLTVTNQFGCTSTIVKSININMSAPANAGPDASVCLGSSISLNAVGGVTYSWMPGGLTGGSITVSPSVNTTYVVSVTDANGCTGTDTVLITVNPLPVATVSPDKIICAGNSATLTAGGGGTYSWSPTGSTSSTITVSPASSTTYAVDVINANGCVSTAFVNVTVNANPVITMPAATFTCSGINTTLNAGVGGTYIWSTGATTQTIAVNQQGVYTVTVTNASGCTSSASSTVTVGGQIVTNSNNISICQGQNAVLNANYPGSTYVWSTGAVTQSITVTNPGIYQVTVTDGNGCSGIIATTVNVNPTPFADFTPHSGCINSAINFNDLSSINGGTITSWSWNFGDGNFSQQQNPVHTYNSAGNYPITLTVTSNLGCTSTASGSVDIYNLPQANFAYSHGCQNTLLQFTDQSNTSFGNITGWLWDFGDGTTSTLQNPTHAFTLTGMQVVTLTITTAGGCTDIRSHNVQIFPEPILAFTTSSNSICKGSSVSITNTSTTSNGAINSWNWNFGDGTSSSQQNPTHIYTTTGTFNIALIAVTSHGCSDTILHQVTVSPVPVANAGNDVWICRGASTNLTAAGSTSYSWSPGGNTTQVITVTPQNTTTYYVTVTNAGGCTATDSVIVNIKNLPNANAGVDKSICVGGSTSLLATGGTSYNWNPGNLTGNSITVNPPTTTSYIVTVMGANGCPKMIQ